MARYLLDTNTCIGADGVILRLIPSHSRAPKVHAIAEQSSGRSGVKQIDPGAIVRRSFHGRDANETDERPGSAHLVRRPSPAPLRPSHGLRRLGRYRGLPSRPPGTLPAPLLEKERRLIESGVRQLTGRVAITSRAADHGPSNPISRTSTCRPCRRSSRSARQQKRQIIHDERRREEEVAHAHQAVKQARRPEMRRGHRRHVRREKDEAAARPQHAGYLADEARLVLFQDVAERPEGNSDIEGGVERHGQHIAADELQTAPPGASAVRWRPTSSMP